MGPYRKLVAAIVATILTRWVLRLFGIDFQMLGLGPVLEQAVSLSIDAGVAAVVGFWVWLLPNDHEKGKDDARLP